MDEFVMIGDVEYRVGDTVVVLYRKGKEVIDTVCRLDLDTGAEGGDIDLEGHGWFCKDTGESNIFDITSMRILRKATDEDIATLDDY